MHKNTLLKLVVTLLFVVWMPTAGAQGEAAIAAKQAEISKLKEKIVQIDVRRREDTAQLEESRKRLQDAQTELQAAKTESSSDASEINTRRVKNAEFAAVLKQREYDRQQERLQNYNVATKQTALKVEALEHQITDLKAGKAPPVQTTEDLAKTQQELEVARARNEAAKQELIKLRAMMKEANGKPAAQTATAAATPTPVPTPAAPATPASEAKPAASPVLAKVTLSKEQRDALDQYERIAKMFREKGLDNAEGPDKVMQIDAMVDFWIESKRSLTFGYLGYGQYIVETKLRNGDATFVVDDQRWRYTVPEQDDNITYMFLLDTTTKPIQLHFFRKDLLAVDVD